MLPVMSCACQLLITHLQLKKMLIMYESAQVTITFQLHEMSSITKSNQTNICTRYIFQIFFRKNFADFTDLHNEKNQIWKLRINGIVSVTGTRVKVYQISKTWQP